MTHILAGSKCARTPSQNNHGMPNQSFLTQQVLLSQFSSSRRSVCPRSIIETIGLYTSAVLSFSPPALSLLNSGSQNTVQHHHKQFTLPTCQDISGRTTIHANFFCCCSSHLGKGSQFCQKVREKTNFGLVQNNIQRRSTV